MTLTFEFAQRRGIILPLAAIMLTVVMIFTAFVTDIGMILVRKTEIQAAADAAALSGVMDLSVDEATVEATVDQYLIDNGANPNLAGITKTLDYGAWDDDTSIFTVGSFATANAIRVRVAMTDVPAIFGGIMGETSYTTSAESIAVQTIGPPRDVVMVLDCSGSMNEMMSNGLTRIENVKNAAALLINSLHDQDRVSLAVYSWRDGSRDANGNGGNDECEVTGKVETLPNFDPQPTLNIISILTDGHYTSGTNIGGGYRAGLDAFLNDPAPRDATEPDLVKVMVMLTDGEVNKLEPLPLPNDGPTGMLGIGPYSNPDDDGEYNTDPEDEESMTQWANTIKSRGIKVYAVKLHGSSVGTFSTTASTPDQYDDQYYFHIADGSEDVSQLLEVYEHIGASKGGPKLVQ